MRRKRILLVVVGVCLLSGIAGADPAPTNRVPLSIGAPATRLSATADSTGGNALPAGTGVEAPRAVGCTPAWNVDQTPLGDLRGSFLHAVETVAQDDVWAVGSGHVHGPATVTEHWNGLNWTLVPSPTVGGGANYLYGIDAASSSDIWAVGAYLDQTTNRHRTLILHYDGTAWTQVTSANKGAGNNYLEAVQVVSPTNVWAVGYFLNAADSVRTLILHYDGVTWRAVASPNPAPSGNYLYGISATSSNDVWAVGSSYEASWGNLQSLVLHYDGVAWSRITSPNVGLNTANLLMDVDATSSSRATAVGFANGTEAFEPIVMTWDGAAWSIVSSLGRAGRLFGVDAVTENDVWAVGDAGGFIEHWDGKSWQVVTGSVAVNAASLLGVSALPSGQVYAAGYQGKELLAASLCEAQVSDTGFSIDTAPIGLGAAAAWMFLTTNLQNHRIRDATGLFNSGLRPPGGSYTFAFQGAGTYSISDIPTHDQMKLQVTPTANPLEGSQSTQFTITWASSSISGFVFDVQVRRPGAPSWEDWKVGATALSDKFVPDAGTGQYSFRARIRRLSDGKASGYSPRVTITVT
jgi:hypothetical protein